MNTRGFLGNIVSAVVIIFTLGIVTMVAFTRLGSLQGSLNLNTTEGNNANMVIGNVTSSMTSMFYEISPLFSVLAIVVILVMIGVLIKAVSSFQDSTYDSTPTKEEEEPEEEVPVEVDETPLEHYKRMTDKLSLRSIKRKRK